MLLWRQLRRCSLALSITLFHSSPHHLTLPQIIYTLHFCLVDTLLNYAAYFVVNWIELRAVRRTQIRKFIEATTIGLHFRNGGGKWCTVCGKDHDQMNLAKNDTVISQHI